LAVLDLNRYAYAALIFDCDGTLVNSAPVHYRALHEAFRAQDLEIPREWYMDRLGLSRSELFHQYEEDFGVKLDFPAAEALDEAIFASILHDLTEIPLIASIVRDHYGKVPMAVASGGQRPLVAKTLEATGLIDYFDHLVTFSDVGEGKPSPALFLEAARRLGRKPHQCLVFDDTDQGVEAAHRANMAVVDVREYLLDPLGN
jgi:beta-phosphoglucomutase-like phosphatase (HAD superfamily)